MKKWKIRAQYMAEVEIEMELEDGVDPMDESKWTDFISEHQTDYRLHDVTGAGEVEEF